MLYKKAMNRWESKREKCAFDILTTYYFVFHVRLLNEAQGSLLDDEQLVNTLQTSKKTSEEVTEQLVVSEQTEAKIDAAREVRASSLSCTCALYFNANTNSTNL